ncbi:hypothetical protein A1O7_04227 [Cladophialophora yegresii CBS 114405]|uniref:tRNA (guanine(9)-N1)-methyltransferase n=1 Tax=Cladophialophora yegresii CBS 114405 TaxID=1182544 RepID=W9VW63_9EURO|nr:uncharacterized protein A1O7_04227 [Cladophialophora yegresii CBS 114405]EXJ60077.1 hypothetical protein A1O7_04227 [Cladophialophora yegresii CBS 114405]
MAESEAEERSTKRRKLDPNESVPADQENSPLLLGVDEAASGSVENRPSSTGTPQQPAADLADTPAEDGENSREGSAPDSAAEPGKKRPRDPDPAEHERLLLQQQQQQQQHNGEPTEPLSKSQLKKLRRREEWEANRDHRKAKRKQKIQEKRARKREARDEEAQRLQLLQQQSPQEQEPKQNEVRHSKSISNATQSQVPKVKPKQPPRHIQLPLTILIDCGFDDLMMEKERISLGSQITRAYSDNHHAPYQAHLVISSWGGLLRERFDTVLRKHYLNWKGVRFEVGDFLEAAQKMDTIMKDPKVGGQLVGIFATSLTDGNAEHEEHKPVDTDTDIAPPNESTTESAHNSDIDMAGHAEPVNVRTLASENQQPESAQEDAPHASSDPRSTTVSAPSTPPRGEIIYLTSDSPHTLSTLSPYSIYIVGGLVDKNRHKGICYKTACDMGIKTAKLPIGEFLEMSSRKVLATNHVVEILLRWFEEAAAGGEDGAWGRAFLRVIPKRKGGKLRGQEGGDDSKERVDQDEDEDKPGAENNEQEDQDGDEDEMGNVNNQREDQAGHGSKAGAEVRLDDAHDN